MSGPFSVLLQKLGVPGWVSVSGVPDWFQAAELTLVVFVIALLLLVVGITAEYVPVVNWLLHLGAGTRRNRGSQVVRAAFAFLFTFPVAGTR